MSNVPKQSGKKELPADTIEQKNIPVGTELNKEQPEESPKLTVVPKESKKLEVVPEISPKKEEMPSDLKEENCVTINGVKVEIKPTKLKYFRNKAASAYGLIKAVPLHELLTYRKGQLDEARDADQLLYDFLVATFDNSEFVRDNYDNMDAEVIDRICKIFGRINHIDEKEEAARKNREAQAQAKH